jgi:hypothetical protein
VRDKKEISKMRKRRGEDMRRRCKFLGGFILVLLLLLVAEGITWAEEKKYPPYPDVWGIELPWPSQSQVLIYKTPNDDFSISYRQEKNIGNKYVVKFLFSGHEMHLTKEDYDKFVKQGKHVGGNKIVLKNGELLQFSPYKECKNSFTDDYFLKTNTTGRVILKKIAFYLHDKPKKITFLDLYELRKCAIHGEMQMTLENVGSGFVLLNDGTFLLINGYGGFIIRFDKDLNTKSELLNKKLFLIDRDVFVKKFLNKHKLGKTAKDLQALHDDLVKYFMDIKNKQQK